MLNLRRQEKDFLARASLNHCDAFTELAAGMQNNLTELEEQAKYLGINVSSITALTGSLPV